MGTFPAKLIDILMGPAGLRPPTPVGGRRPCPRGSAALDRDSGSESLSILFLTGKNAFVIQKQTKNGPFMMDALFYFYFYGFLGGFDFISSTQRPLT
jgi:hypothetical protein